MVFSESSRKPGDIIYSLGTLRVVPSAPPIGVTALEGRDPLLPAAAADTIEVLNIALSHISVVSIAGVLPIFKHVMLV